MGNWRHDASHEYVVVVTGDDPLATWKAAEHLKFTMHWDRSFMSVASEDSDSTASQYVIRGYGDWKNMRVDVSNFTNYHPHATFTVTVDGAEVLVFSYKDDKAA